MRQLILSLLLVVLWTPSAFAGLCKAGNIESRHNREAESLERENFATAVSPLDGTSDYIDSRTYNAHVLACNRKRDTLGNKIEKDIGSDHVFEANLAARLVKGHYNYFGNIVTQQRYMYRLERTNGNWIVTIPAEFHFPELKRPNSSTSRCPWRNVWELPPPFAPPQSRAAAKRRAAWSRKA